jgi:YegS/Rv2252/BmrU family lipid kinase
MSDNFKTLIIANPASSGGSLRRHWGSIASTIRQAFGPFENRFTEYPRHATVLAREALQGGFEQVVALGGDGTLSEVSAGFLDGDRPVREGAVLGLLPHGTGGDFRKTAGISKDLAESAAALRGRRTRPLDLGRIHYTRSDGTPASGSFVNIASFGMSGLVDRFVNQSSKLLGGLLSFGLATAHAAAVYRNQLVSLSLDGAAPFELRIANVAVANGRYFGGGMKVAPFASLDDGLLDVIGIGDFSPVEMLSFGYRIYLGTHLDHPKVRPDRARRLEARPVNPADDVLLDVDGETPGKLPATFEVLPSIIRLKVPG